MTCGWEVYKRNVPWVEFTITLSLQLLIQQTPIDSRIERIQQSLGSNISLLQLKSCRHNGEHRSLNANTHRSSLEQSTNTFSLESSLEHLIEGGIHLRSLGCLHTCLNHIHGRHYHITHCHHSYLRKPMSFRHHSQQVKDPKESNCH